MNTFGKAFRVTTFGESHGGAVGCVIDGCPARIPIDLSKVQELLNRRRPGQSAISTQRNEPDHLQCLAGIEDGITLGTPIMLLVHNQDARPEDYAEIHTKFRPSHADYTTEAKWGIRAKSGGGRASVRETIGRVAAAGIAEQVFAVVEPELRVVGFVDSICGITASLDNVEAVSRAVVDEHMTRCPDPRTREAMLFEILKAQAEGDSLGGSVSCVVQGCPVGLGEPVFDKLHGELAKAMMSLPATRGFEIGSGFHGCTMRGSAHNDAFVMREGRVGTMTNHSGGVQGGISNGETIRFRVGFKPVSTIAKPQQTVTVTGETTTIAVKEGRHDPCVLPRAVPLVEAMTVLVLMDLWLRHRPNVFMSMPSRQY